MSEEDNIKNAAVKAAQSIVIEFGISAVKPAGEELSKGLVTIAKAVNIALVPLSGLVWGYERIESYIKESLGVKFQGKSPDEIISPPIHIAGPLIETLRFTANQEVLCDMYMNLLASSMDKDSIILAHPSFVEIIKQLSPDEAKILYYLPSVDDYPNICRCRESSGWSYGRRVYEGVSKDFIRICENAEIEHLSLYSSYLDNLRRLLLIEFRQEGGENKIEKGRQNKLDIEYETTEHISVTSLGKQFISACVQSAVQT